jgi:hypothetical protein
MLRVQLARMIDRGLRRPRAQPRTRNFGAGLAFDRSNLNDSHGETRKEFRSVAAGTTDCKKAAWLYHFVMSKTDITPEFQRGWQAALLAARDWHESQAKKAIVQSRRSRFPKNLEREAEVHQKSAELIVTLGPEDV